MTHLFQAILLIVLLYGTPADAQQIEIVCHWGHEGENQLDTRAGTFTKDMISNPDTTVWLTLTWEQKQEVLSFADSIGFFQYPGMVPFDFEEVLVLVDSASGEYALQGSGWGRDPCEKLMLGIVTSEREYTVSWDDCMGPRHEMVEPLDDLVDMIVAMVMSNPEYRALPRPRGAYQ